MFRYMNNLNFAHNICSSSLLLHINHHKTEWIKITFSLLVVRLSRHHSRSLLWISRAFAVRMTGTGLRLALSRIPACGLGFFQHGGWITRAHISTKSKAEMHLIFITYPQESNNITSPVLY